MSTVKMADISESENGRHKCSTFILPQGSTSYSANPVNGMTINNIKGIRTLCHRNNPVQSLTIEQALGDFLGCVPLGGSGLGFLICGVPFEQIHFQISDLSNPL